MKENLYYRTGNKGNVDFTERWNDLNKILDLNQNDTVLDVGCAEGLISIEVAKKVKFVEAFDKEPYRIKTAINNANGCKNINFVTSSYSNYTYKTYDKVLCLGVYKPSKDESPNSEKGRAKALNRIFASCTQQLYLRIPVISDKVDKSWGVSDVEVLKIADNNNFNLVYRSEPRYNHGTLFKFQKR